MHKVFGFLLELLPTLVTMAVVNLLFAFLGQFRDQVVAKLSIEANLMHIALTWAFPLYFLPKGAGGFPAVAQFMFWGEFFLMLAAMAPLTNWISWQQKNPPPDVENYSLTSVSAEPAPERTTIKGKQWMWMLAVVVCFVGMVGATVVLRGRLS